MPVRLEFLFNNEGVDQRIVIRLDNVIELVKVKIS
jgi:hypothetical protein